MPFNRKTRSLALLPALVLLASSCGGGETTSSGLNPLEEALGLENGFEGSYDQEAARRQQESVAACMKEKGFEYKVSVPDAEIFEDIGDFESKEYAEEWGFGISTQAFSQDAVGPELKGHEFDFDGEFEDPNQEIVESLSTEERQAYEEALYGSSSDEQELEEDFTEDSETDGDDFALPEGCFGEALENDPFFAIFSELGDELEEQEERMLADPGFKELDKKLSECISKSGSDVPDFEKYQEELQERVDEVRNDAYGFNTEAEEEPIDEDDFETGDLPDNGAEGEAEPSDEGAEDGPESGDELTEDDFEEPELTADQKTDLGEIQTEELEVAVVAFECEEDGIREERQELENKYLQEFVDQNKATIDKHVKK